MILGAARNPDGKRLKTIGDSSGIVAESSDSGRPWAEDAVAGERLVRLRESREDSVRVGELGTLDTGGQTR